MNVLVCEQYAFWHLRAVRCLQPKHVSPDTTIIDGGGVGSDWLTASDNDNPLWYNESNMLSPIFQCNKTFTSPLPFKPKSTNQQQQDVILFLHRERRQWRMENHLQNMAMNENHNNSMHNNDEDDVLSLLLSDKDEQILYDSFLSSPSPEDDDDDDTLSNLAAPPPPTTTSEQPHRRRRLVFTESEVKDSNPEDDGTIFLLPVAVASQILMPEMSFFGNASCNILRPTFRRDPRDGARFLLAS